MFVKIRQVAVDLVLSLLLMGITGINAGPGTAHLIEPKPLAGNIEEDFTLDNIQPPPRTQAHLLTSRMTYSSMAYSSELLSSARPMMSLVLGLAEEDIVILGGDKLSPRKPVECSFRTCFPPSLAQSTDVAVTA